MSKKWKGRQAVVIGAGVSGLVAASALADHFERIVVLERDELEGAAPRAGVPQGKHPHVLLAGGLIAVNELLPGFTRSAVQSGGHTVDAGMDAQVELPGLPALPRNPLGIHLVAMSRPRMEFVMRTRLEERRNVSLAGGGRQIAILGEPDGGAVTAVSYENRDGERQMLSAELIVDATGRGTPTIEFLKSVGLPEPEETVIGVDVNYATALYDVPAAALPDFTTSITLAEAPEKSRCGCTVLREDGLWFVLLVSRGADKSPADEDAFVAFSQDLRTKTTYDLIKSGKRRGEIARYSFVESRRRHFNRMPAFPRGLIPLGDSVCRLNPVYGHGMTVAAKEAVVLRDVLAAHAVHDDPLAGIGRDYLQRIESVIDDPWTMSSIPDLIYPGTRGQRPENLQQMLEYQFALSNAATRDPALHKLYVETLQLIKPASVLNSPEVMEKVKALNA
ncbi:FAD-dependent oxidoreductase [Paraburkholderia solisilvae]|uniref:Epoxidase LasC n=1 Tax=Paraburkholderia solisilvae TaxID=624376 RepID=A0A6J5DS72_9BURK|nr:FAD-dependent monooxygenase [Paraburkholderia solisilvae]CAB3755746.1 Putative epoxidase LasC [Paraburkholderia solisilvae]